MVLFVPKCSDYGEYCGLESSPGLSACDPCGTATATAVAGDQLAAFYIEGIAFDDLPFVKSTLAEGLAFVFFLQGRAFEVNDITHRYTPW